MNWNSDMKLREIGSQMHEQSLESIVQQENIIGGSSSLELQSLQMNEKISDKIRSTNHLNERYTNSASDEHSSHLANDWTEQETEALFNLFQMYGSKWTKISKQIKGKSQNSVKNRFYGSLRKALRKMNRAAKVLVKKFKKQVKYESITRIIDASQGLFRLQSPLKQQSENLTKKILSLAKNSSQSEQMLSSQAEELILQINKFNMATRSYKCKKKIKNQAAPAKQLRLLKKQTLSSSKQCSQAQSEQLTQEQKHESRESKQNRLCFDDGMIDLMQDDLICTKNAIFDLDLLLSELQSPLECEAWI